ncbi:TVP38/TMEM64 family protein [Terasakiella pusilla]|jgi:uncharacterized membrane protein YdjX (TVP38/TMEM64 family)|uniref:TVP38/TMEM64 family protein n=1 Tax=Terasakiella pusilla TaxID=64973 RepID=UPI00056E7864|nr:TVP38/TMEM64 family protein [Terasakiella pusilla]
MKNILFLISILILFGLYIYFDSTGLLETFFDTKELKNAVQELRDLGPIAIIILMTTAIVLAPLPSAPIALIAGALYGHLWGTIYILIGAELGAIIAFGLARYFGHEFLNKWIDTEAISRRFLGSQNVIMGIVFISRLLPFVSFDIVSYAAGLSSISAWRFAIATLAGIIPASFLLAHFGEEFSSFNTERIVISVLVLGCIMALPVAIKICKRRLKT